MATWILKLSVTIALFGNAACFTTRKYFDSCFTSFFKVSIQPKLQILLLEKQSTRNFWFKSTSPKSTMITLQCLELLMFLLSASNLSKSFLGDIFDYSFLCSFLFFVLDIYRVFLMTQCIESFRSGTNFQTFYENMTQ